MNTEVHVWSLSLPKNLCPAEAPSVILLYRSLCSAEASDSCLSPIRSLTLPVAEPAEASDLYRSTCPLRPKLPVSQPPRARGCVLGYVQRLFTVLDPIPERVGQPHQSASLPSIPHLPVPVVCTMEQAVSLLKRLA